MHPRHVLLVRERRWKEDEGGYRENNRSIDDDAPGQRRGAGAWSGLTEKPRARG